MAGKPDSYLPIAKCAKIPAAKTGGFLYNVSEAVLLFESLSKLDDDRRKLKPAINKVKLGTNGLLRALKHLDGHSGGSAMLDCLFVRTRRMDQLFGVKQKDHRDPRWSKKQWDFYHDGRWADVMPEGGPLGECRAQIELLGKAAKRASIEELPKNARNRTRTLIAQIWVLAEHAGGKLKYDKNNNTGSMADVIAFLRKRTPARFWTNLSPSTIERLRPKR